MHTETLNQPGTVQDPLDLIGTDHIEFYVSNAKQAAHYYQSAFGFNLVAFSGLETGDKEKVSYVLQQGKVRFVLSAALNGDHPIAEHVRLHGDGVKVLALEVADAEKAFNTAVERGAKVAAPLNVMTDEFGEIRTASIYTYGETFHTFVERKNYTGPFMPGFMKAASKMEIKPLGLKYIDHCVGNVELGQMNEWVKFYENVMGFKLLLSFDDNDISTEYTALMSKVVSNGNGYVKFPINEPAAGRKKSQIEEYLDFYKTAGVQHVALATSDIIQTVGQLRKNGVEFLYVPDTYYDDLSDRVGEIKEEIAELKKLNILVDRDEEGYLLQIFTKPVQDRPTVFYEIIQRAGAQSFGKGNFKALFESIEREQELRGTL
jgi:4-hydroxyphenylpyruvate dioxygenase